MQTRHSATPQQKTKFIAQAFCWKPDFNSIYSSSCFWLAPLRKFFPYPLIAGEKQVRDKFPLNAEIRFRADLLSEAKVNE